MTAYSIEDLIKCITHAESVDFHCNNNKIIIRCTLDKDFKERYIYHNAFEVMEDELKNELNSKPQSVLNIQKFLCVLKPIMQSYEEYKNQCQNIVLSIDENNHELNFEGDVEDLDNKLLKIQKEIEEKYSPLPSRND